MDDSLVELFCHVDDFCQGFLPTWQEQLLTHHDRQRQRQRSLSLSEVMTILIHFHQSHYRHFKAYYIEHVCRHLHREFPTLVSYSRFVEYMPAALIPLAVYLRQHGCGLCTGLSFIDSTPLAVCHNARIAGHRVFVGLAERGKSSTGWFYGFKLHLVCNDRGELLNFILSPGNVDDRRPVLRLTKQLFGKLLGDKGYLSQALTEALWQRQGLQLITKVRRNMKSRLLPLADKLLLRQWVIIETVIDPLKNISQVEHSRHRSPVNFLVNLFCGLIAYSRRPMKPSLGLEHRTLLPA